MKLKIIMALCGQFMAFQLAAQDSSEIQLTQYCTEIGVFNLTFDNNEVAGAYSLIPKGNLGAIWGTLEGNQVKGRWIDPDGSGDITLTFNEDRTWFTTDYRADDAPEKWYRDQWHGAIRPEGEDVYQFKTNTYRCQ